MFLLWGINFWGRGICFRRKLSTGQGFFIGDSPVSIGNIVWKSRGFPLENRCFDSILTLRWWILMGFLWWFPVVRDEMRQGRVYFWSVEGDSGIEMVFFDWFFHLLFFTGGHHTEFTEKNTETRKSIRFDYRWTHVVPSPAPHTESTETNGIHEKGDRGGGIEWLGAGAWKSPRE